MKAVFNINNFKKNIVHKMLTKYYEILHTHKKRQKQKMNEKTTEHKTVCHVFQIDPTGHETGKTLKKNLQNDEQCDGQCDSVSMKMALIPFHFLNSHVSYPTIITRN